MKIVLFLLFLSIILCCFAIYKLQIATRTYRDAREKELQSELKVTQAKKINSLIEMQTSALNEQLKQLDIKKQEINTKTLQHTEEQAKINTQIQQAKEELAFHLSEIQKLEQQFQKSKQVSMEAADNYFQVLEKSYEQKENEYHSKVAAINASIKQYQQDIEQVKQNRAAAIEAIRKEKQIKLDKAQYCVCPTLEDLNDIQELERIKPLLKKPRVLAMLIWSSYYQPIAKKKFVEILGTKKICGVYKITNQLTDECYIGQAVDCYTRWNDHLKAGIGIDTPANNKLYKSMQEYGIQNFTFELLQECKREELNKQEKYFISLYESDAYGFNSTKGNG